MHPAYELGKLQIQSYGFHFVLSCLVMILALAILLRIRDQNAAPSIDLTLLLILGQVVVAKILYNLLTKNDEFLPAPGAPKFRSGFWGGQLGFGLLAGLYLLWTRAPIRPLADALGVAWAFSSVLHKIGCFMAGCCYGSPTGLPWGAVFPAGGSCGLPGQSLHPSQLYDAALSFLAGLFLLWAYLGRRWEGRLLLLSAFLYAVSKYATEWTRGDARYLTVGPLSAAMAVELVTAAVCALLLTKPAAWNFVLALRELRTAAARVPEATVGRGVAFALTLGNAIGALFAAMLAAAVTRNEVLAVAAIPAYYVVVSLLSPVNPVLKAIGLRVVNGSGEPPSFLRRLVRGLVATLTMSSFFGVFRPLLDRWGRGLGDAASGTFLVRRVP